MLGLRELDNIHQQHHKILSKNEMESKKPKQGTHKPSGKSTVLLCIRQRK